MRKQNKVKQLQRNSEHRNALLKGMAESLFYHERITSTVAKIKTVRRFSEKLITRAKKNLEQNITQESKLHNIRLVNRYIKNKEVIRKLFQDIIVRNKDRNGGYTRIIKLGFRNSDKSEMALLELVNKKDIAVLKSERKEMRSNFSKKKKGKSLIEDSKKLDEKNKIDEKKET